MPTLSDLPPSQQQINFIWTFSKHKPDDVRIGQPLAIAADETHVYWTNADGEVMRVRKSGGAAERIALGPPGSDCMTLDAHYVYWACYHEQLVLCVPKAGGEISILAAGQERVFGLCAEGGEVFWANCGKPSGAGEIMQMRRSGGTPEVGVLQRDLDRSAWLLVDREHLYWTNDRMVYGAIWRAPRSGGTPVRIASDLGLNKLVGLDETWIYWLDSSKHLERVRKKGGPVVSLRARCGSLLWCCVQPEGILAIEEGTNQLIRIPEDPGLDVERGPVLFGQLFLADSERVYFLNESGDVIAHSLKEGTYQPLFTDPRPRTYTPHLDSRPPTHFPVPGQEEEDDEKPIPWEELIEIPRADAPEDEQVLVMTGDVLYWVAERKKEKSALMRWALGSAAAPEQLALVHANKIRRLLVDATGAYLISYAEQSVIWRVPTDGGPPQRLASPGGLVKRAAIGDGDIYVIRYSAEESATAIQEEEARIRAGYADYTRGIRRGPAALLRIPKDGSAAEEIAPDRAGLNCVAVDTTHVYWTVGHDDDAGEIWRAPKRGGEAELIVRDVAPQGLAVDADSIAWTDGRWDAVMLVPKSELGRKAPLVLDPRAHVFARTDQCDAITLRRSTVYWTSYDSEYAFTAVFACPRSGGSARVVGWGGDIGLDRDAITAIRWKKEKSEPTQAGGLMSVCVTKSISRPFGTETP